MKGMHIEPNRHHVTTAGPAEAAGHLQPNALVGSAPNESVVYSPIPCRPYRRDPYPDGRIADLPAGLATPQTPRSVSRLAGVSPGVGVGDWPSTRSPSVPIMALLQVQTHTRTSSSEYSHAALRCAVLCCAVLCCAVPVCPELGACFAPPNHPCSARWVGKSHTLVM